MGQIFGQIQILFKFNGKMHQQAAATASTTTTTPMHNDKTILLDNDHTITIL
jgi:hypothetical protein